MALRLVRKPRTFHCQSPAVETVERKDQVRWIDLQFVFLPAQELCREELISPIRVPTSTLFVNASISLFKLAVALESGTEAERAVRVFCGAPNAIQAKPKLIHNRNSADLRFSIKFAPCGETPLLTKPRWQARQRPIERNCRI